jgi:hypothetical protein
MKNMKNRLIQAMCILSCGWMLSGCTEGQIQEAEKKIFVDYASLSMIVGDEVQITASPTNQTFTWESEDVAIATVSASGEVRATGAGRADITVSYDDVRRTIPVDVVAKIPLTGINLGTTYLELTLGKSITLLPRLIPENSNERGSFSWQSENSDIVSVSDNGELLGVARGETNIVCRYGNVTASVHVLVVVLLNKPGWSVISYSDEQSGYGPGAIIDGILNANNYWHSRWSSPQGELPHWAIIDMVSPQKINKIETYRRLGIVNTKTVQYFVSDEPDPDASSWVKIMEGMFDESSDLLTVDALENNIQRRYLKIFMPDSYGTSPHTAISEIYVYSK